jgi:hypothetical protein
MNSRHELRQGSVDPPFHSTPVILRTPVLDHRLQNRQWHTPIPSLINREVKLVWEASEFEPPIQISKIVIWDRNIERVDIMLSKS